MVFKKKKVPGTPFVKSLDSRRNSNGRPSVTLDCVNLKYKRFDKELVDLVQNNTNLPLVKLDGVRLRPKLQSDNVGYEHDDNGSNDVIDLKKLSESQQSALKEHKHFAVLRKSTKHVPNLRLLKIRNQGFGVCAYYTCSGCKFKSSTFKLFECTASGACVTNIQAGVAFSKSALKPSDAHFFLSTLNINGPSPDTLQAHFTRANKESASLLDTALSANRGIVRDCLSIEKGSSSDLVPAIPVAFDGQYDRPLYHGYDGHSSSVSEPVLEAQTGLNLLVSHAVVSKLDGSYEAEKVGC